ncbi:MAG TPA: hypothetical protein PLA05_00805 [bacterium]|jgi:fatty acid desaturase|nr:MAG: hypothetical protein BWX82_00437 [Parcubacteria group bacterium ADurb.Bin115]HNU81233.1 hypothetical protein [bacterium]HOD86884.1 hypothetical protein [bacterium]HPW05492.1 hypothetical protein [bacterium]HPY99216.1 hypothetical protein [bacterium]
MIILGLIIIAVGTVLIIKTEWFLQNFGRLSWFENKLGSEGGSRLGYKLLGLVAIFIGIVLMSGNGNDFFTWLLGPLIPKQ